MDIDKPGRGHPPRVDTRPGSPRIYPGVFVSAPETTLLPAPVTGPTLEILWQEDVAALVFERAPDGTISDAGLTIGAPAFGDLDHLGKDAIARKVGLVELLTLEPDLPDLAPGVSAQVVLATLSLASRSVTEGLVHPHLEFGGGRWNALWGATLDERVSATLAQLAEAMPSIGAWAFDGDREEAVYDLYGCAVDRIARERLHAARVRLGGGRLGARPATLAHALDGLTGLDPELPATTGYAGLEERLTEWVDEGLAKRSSAPWTICLRLDERPSRDHGESVPEIVLEVLLQAADDPTLVLPAALLWDGEADVFSFVRASDPRRVLTGRLRTIEPLLAEGGIVFDGDEPTETVLEDDAVRFLLRDAIPRLEEHGVTVLLPASWVSASARLKVNLVATSTGPVGRGSGLLARDSLATFDWKLALGDVTLTEEELVELAAAKEPLLRIRGRWHALRRADVDRALRFLERRREGNVVDLVRAIGGIETDDAGLELGEVTLDETLSELLAGNDRQSFRVLGTPAGMRHSLFPFQERGHGWLRFLGDLGVGAILADDMGLGKTVQAIAMLVSEREDRGSLGPTLVVCPMSITRQWVKEIDRFAPDLRVHLHHGTARLTGEELAQTAAESDVMVTSYDIATRDIEHLEPITWDRVLFDEAQDAKNPATKRARAMRRLRGARRLALTGTPIENRLGELWAIMDLVNPGLLGSHDRFDRMFARPIEAGNDELQLERLRTMVQPFILRRAKDDDEVALDLPKLIVSRVECHLTVEQASLYRATVDRWLPRVEEHEDRFGRRGAVLAMLSQLKQVCNHPELVVPTGRPLDGRSGKLETLVDLLLEVPADDKALVFTQYPGFDRLAPYLAERTGREVGFFHGGLHARQRDELVEAFSSPGGPSLMVVSIRAGGRGLNLPAANHVFHFDRWWNPAVEQQATDRAYRFGQTKDVTVYSLICKATLEERIDLLLESKRELAAKVISARSTDWLGDLDLDAIRAAVELSDEATEDER
jgi:SNF2-related domain/SNF2 Helicase protein/Helicase conserved C-terminal domain